MNILIYFPGDHNFWCQSVLKYMRFMAGQIGKGYISGCFGGNSFALVAYSWWCEDVRETSAAGGASNHS